MPLFAAACTGGASPGASAGSAAITGNQPPAITSAKILQDPISLAGPVTAQVYAEDPEREAVVFHYQWYVDGVLLPSQTGAILSADLLRRGQVVSVEIVPADGSQKGKAYRTASVMVGNTPPKVTAVSLAPQAVRPGEKVEAHVEAGDPDHDRVDLTYKWFRNGVSVKEGDEAFLETAGLAAHDQIIVEVAAQDPAAAGNSLRSDPLVLGNNLPQIVSAPPAPTAPNLFEYAVKAVDPDGDRLSYQLEASPAGMTIDEKSGQIAWQIPADGHGVFHVKVVAKDGQGGVAIQEFDLTLTSEAPAKSPGA